jgi:hypothetical protein
MDLPAGKYEVIFVEEELDLEKKQYSLPTLELAADTQWLVVQTPANKYFLDASSWRSLRVINRRQRIIKPGQLLLATPPPPQPLALSRSGSKSPLVKSTGEIAPFVKHQPRSLWLHEFSTKNVTPGDVLVYLSILCDYVLWKEALHGQIIESVFYSYVHKRLGQIPANTVYVCLRDCLCREGWEQLAKYWMAMELWLFQPEDTLMQMRRHLWFVREKRNWHERGECFLSDDLYCLPVLWLFEQEFTLFNGLVKKGRLFLDEEAFQRHFIPCLARLVLEDLLSSCPEPPSYLLQWEDHPLQLPDLRDKKWPALAESVFAFQCDHQFVTGPVMKRMPRYWAERKPSRSYNDARVSRLVDIEDLFAPSEILPPCLKAAITRPRYKNDDRYHLVRSLVDMGYEKREILTEMCRDGKGDRAQISRNCDEWLETKKQKDKRISAWCAKVVQLNPGAGNVFTCPYTEEKREYSKEEMERITGECQCKGGIKWRPYSPLDFIDQRLKQLYPDSQ